MKFNKHIHFIMLFFFISGGLWAQKKWTLNECISYAIENNLNLKEYDLIYKINRENFNQSKRNLLPGLSATSNAGLNYGRSVDPITNDYITTEFFTNSFNLRTSATLFDGFRLQNQIKYEKYRIQESENKKLNAIDDLAFKVMTAFFDVLYYEGMLNIAEEQVEASKLNLKATEKQVQVGLKARSDLLEMRANLEMEELYRIQISNNKKTAMLQLKQHMNKSDHGDLELVALSENGIMEQTTDPDDLFNRFKSWSPYYKSFEANLLATEKELDLYRANLYPFISVGGSVYSGYSETNRNSAGEVIGFSDQFKNNRSQYLGASLRIPVFNKWFNRSNIKKAKLEIERAQNQLESEQQNLYFKLVNDLNELKALYKEFNQYKRQNEADDLAFKAAEKKFEQGLINVVEYYISKNRLANTKSEVLRSRLQWEIKKKTLEFYQGRRFWEN